MFPTDIDWPGSTVYQFHPLCGEPEASGLFTVLHSLGGVKKIAHWSFLLPDVQNAKQQLLDMVPFVFPGWRQIFYIACFHQEGRMVVMYDCSAMCKK